MRKPSNTNEGKKKESPKGKRKLQYQEKQEKTKRPLVGKAIYLDVKDIRQSKQIEADLKRLGASVEEFLIKDINYVITSQPRPKGQKNDDKIGSADSPAAVSTPSPFNCGPSPSGVTEKKVPAVTVTRGKAILQKAQLTRKTSSVIENAEKWGVKIIPLEAALKYILKEIAKLPKESQKNDGTRKAGSVPKTKRLKQPLLKFESDTNQYKPIYSQLESWPHPNVETPRGTCPFDGITVGRGERSQEERGDRIGLVQADNDSPIPTLDGETNNSAKEKDEDKSKSRPSDYNGIMGGVRIVTAGEIRRRKEMKRLAEKKRGYCECCMLKYEDLEKHVREEQHRAYIRDKKNYEDLDHMIKTGPNTALFLQRVLMQHCVNKRGQSKPANSDLEDTNSQQQQKAKSTNARSTKPTTAIKKSAVSHCVGRSPRKISVEIPKRDTESEKQLTHCSVAIKRHSGLTSSKFIASVSKKVLKEELKLSAKPVESVEKAKDGSVVSSSVSKVSKEHKGYISPDDDMKKACTNEDKRKSSDGLDLKNHVIPKRTKNAYESYLQMSPSQRSWKNVVPADKEVECEEHANNELISDTDVAIHQESVRKTPQKKSEKNDKNIAIIEDKCINVKHSLRNDVVKSCDKPDSLPQKLYQQTTGRVCTKTKRLAINRRCLRDTEKYLEKQISHDDVDGNSISKSPPVCEKVRRNMKTKQQSAVLIKSPKRSLMKSPEKFDQRHENIEIRNTERTGKKHDEIKDNSKRNNKISCRLNPLIDIDANDVNINKPSTFVDCQSSRLSPRNLQVSKKVASIVNNSTGSADVITGIDKNTNDGGDSVVDKKTSPRESRASQKLNTSHNRSAEVETDKKIATSNHEKNTKPKDPIDVRMSPRVSRLSPRVSRMSPRVSQRLVVDKCEHNSTDVNKSVACKLENSLEDEGKIDLKNIRKQKASTKHQSFKKSHTENSSVDRDHLSDQQIHGLKKNIASNVEQVRLQPKNIRISRRNSAKVENKFDNLNVKLDLDKTDCNNSNVNNQLSTETRNVKITRTSASVSNADSNIVRCRDTESQITENPINTKHGCNKRSLLSQSIGELAFNKKLLKSDSLQPKEISSADSVIPRTRTHTDAILLVTHSPLHSDLIHSCHPYPNSCGNVSIDISPQKIKRSLIESPLVEISPRKQRIKKDKMDERNCNSQNETSGEKDLHIHKQSIAQTNSSLSKNNAVENTEEEDIFFVNSMELVKQRSLLRQKALTQAQAGSDTANSASPSTSKSSRKLFRKERTPRRNSASSSSDIRTAGSSKLSELKKVKANKLIKVSLDKCCKADSSSNVRRLSRIEKKDDKVLSRCQVDMNTSSWSKKSLDRVAGSSSDSHHRTLRNQEGYLQFNSESNKLERVTGEHRSPSRSCRHFSITRSSPAFKKSPRFRKRMVTLYSSENKSTKRTNKKNFDVYDINNELGNTPTKTKKGEKYVESPQSCSSTTKRSRKRKWCAKKHSDSSQADEKPIPAPKRLRRLVSTKAEKNQELVNDVNLTNLKLDPRVINCSNKKGKPSATNGFQKQSPDLSRDNDSNKFAMKTNSVAKMKIDLVNSSKNNSSGSSTKTLDKFVAIKKLELNDLRILSDDYVDHNNSDSVGKKPNRERKSSDSCSESGNTISGKKSDKEQNSSFTLQWHSVVPVQSPETDQKNSSKTVKLDRSWPLLTDRSVAKMLESESESESFEGFKPDDLHRESLLGSDMSFVEADEVELDGNSEQEWDFKQDTSDSDVVDYVVGACTFTSPGKRTDSSWDDPFDDYIDTQLHLNKSGCKSHTFSPQRTSPRRREHEFVITKSPSGQKGKTLQGVRSSGSNTPRKRKLSEQNEFSSQGFSESLHCTPKRRKLRKSATVNTGNDDNEERVDEDIVFNYCSPQKMKSFQSPLKIIEEVVDSSSPLKGGEHVTSTPSASCSRQKTQKFSNVIATEEFPALNMQQKSPDKLCKTGCIPSPVISSETKTRKIIKNKSSIKKKFSLTYNKKSSGTSAGRTSKINLNLHMSHVETVVVSPKR